MSPKRPDVYSYGSRGRTYSKVLLRGALLLGALVLFAPAPAPAAGQEKTKGKWGDEIKLANVPIHMHVLPNGKVMYWGRREWDRSQNPAKPAGDGSLDPQDCVPRLWDPGDPANPGEPLPKPGFNLFCAGHAFLPDGRLLVAGGHIADGKGVNRAANFNFQNSQWEPLPDRNGGRWYPTVVSLADGTALVSSGAIRPGQMNNPVQQVLDANDQWRNTVDFQGLPLYPRMHVAPDGRVFMSGHLKLTQLLNTTTNGWQVVGNSVGAQREDGCSVMFAPGKVLLIGGGQPPQKSSETIDLTQPGPAWKADANMKHARRHHNATLLPDGTVLVTGGTKGPGFNDLSQPVLEPELWDPATGKWKRMATEKFPRLYHSAAVLLPDATVLSGGGGEYRPNNGSQPNDPKDSHLNAQIYSPPYLFQGGTRPVIADAPDEVEYGEDFEVTLAQAGPVELVSLVRLSSTTHSLNMNQRINFLEVVGGDGAKLTLRPPNSENECPPGHYMLFVLGDKKVPSKAKIVRVH